MADTSSLFLLLLTLFALYTASSAQQRNSTIRQGSSLTPTTNSSWLSSSGLYAFGFYRQGNGYAVGIFIAGIPERTVVWTANRDDPPVPTNSTLLFTADGRLILQPTQADEIDVISGLSQSASTASMRDSGNFVLYNSGGQIIWQSFNHPTDTLLQGQRLLNGLQLISSISKTQHSTGLFVLAMQGDGNLVQYPVETRAPSNAIYASGTDGTGNNVTLNLDDDGHLYLINSSIAIIRNLTDGGYPTQTTIYLMRNDADGIFRVYSHNLSQNGNWSTIWSSSNDKCAGRGLCGLNGYCDLMDEDPQCVCLPGFDFHSPGNWSAGCERNYTAGSCTNEDQSIIRYNMRALDNTVWEDDSYSVLEATSRDDCEAACLEDCNCEAALLIDRVCRKQRLPLRYGRRLPSSSDVAFVKVGTPTPINEGVPPNLPKESKKELRVDILIISISLVVFAFIVLVISGIFIYKNREYKKIPDMGNVELGEDFALRAFTYAEVERMTNGFKEEVGRGASGTVYKGKIPNRQKPVAVKRLEKVLEDGEREFQTEMKVIRRTYHRNLVRLLGYCLDGPKKLLVYEYMSNGSLADILFTPENRPSWEERTGIALDIARGILYLHEECETQIIHCDIKPQNILMDDYRSARISDFGLAKLLKPDQTRTFTGIRGTRGYVAPEWHRNLPVSVKADVYSFGIVLFEIISCRKSVDCNLSEDEAVLEEWVYQCFEEGELGKLVGDEVVDKRKIDRMVKVGLWCIQDEPSLRPSMKKVLLMLEGTVDIPIPPSPTSFLSAM